MASDAQLLEQGQAAIASIVNLALACPAGGDGRWDATLSKLGVTPLGAEDRAKHLREGPGQSRGALLIELRWAVDAAVTPLCEAMDEYWPLRNQADQAVRDYVSAVKPRVTTSSIFANALAHASTSPSRVSGSADASADPCGCCGAPRSDRSSKHCRYCGEQR